MFFRLLHLFLMVCHFHTTALRLLAPSTGISQLLLSKVVLVTHCSIGMAENATRGVDRLSVPIRLFIVSKILKENSSGSVLAPFAAFANMAFPVRMLTVHGPFEYKAFLLLCSYSSVFVCATP